MNELAKTAFNRRPDLHVETEGEFAGWRTWTRDNFETHTGPFYHRMDENGRITCAFRVGKKHLNGSGNVHGGCFMTFADYCLFALAGSVLQGPRRHGIVRLGIPRRRPRGRSDRVHRRGHPCRHVADLRAGHADIGGAAAVLLLRHHQAGEAQGGAAGNGVKRVTSVDARRRPAVTSAQI
ncbi:acyl-coenzyme A thioesterase PaaI-like protein [Bradyrhizobium elkanii]